MSTLQTTSPLSVRWTIFDRAAATPESPSQSQTPAKIERRERLQYESPEDLAGRVLCEHYELTRRLGYGGIGEVYEARFLASGQRVAVKLLFARFADEPEMMTRFRHELQVLEAIVHPGIVGVRDLDQTSDGRPFLVMELIEGRDLRALLREHTRTGRILGTPGYTAPEVVDEPRQGLGHVREDRARHRPPAIAVGCERSHRCL